MIVACCGGSTIEIHNNSDVLDGLIYSTFLLLVGIDPTSQEQFLSLTDILLPHSAFFWRKPAGVLQSLTIWAHIPCVQQ